MRKGLIAILLLTSSWASAERTKTIFNPQTGKSDYITRIDSSTIIGGTGITITSLSSGAVIVTGSTSTAISTTTFASITATQTFTGGQTFVGSTTFRGALAYTGQTAYAIPYLNLNKTLTSSIFFTIYAPGSGGTHGIDMNTNGLTGGFSAIGVPVVNSTHTAIDISLDGSNIPFSETAVSGVVAGTGVHNIAGRFSATGGTTNVGLDVTGQEILAGSATVTQGIVTSTITVSTVTLSGQMKFTSRNNILTSPGGTTILSIPDAFTTYFGEGAGGTPTSGGTFNSAFGSSAMPTPGTGNFNSCIGAFCMSGSVIAGGENNNAMGYASCGNLRAGFYNNCMGGSAGNFLRDGNYNTNVGAYAGERNVDNNGNTNIGFESGKYQNGGDFVTNVGYHAGVGTTTLTNSNVLGVADTYIGKNTGQGVSSSTVVSNSIAIGNGALVFGSLKAQIGGTAGTGLEVETLVSSVTLSGWNQLASRTKTILASMTPTVVGQYYYCSDCTTITTCVSTGTAKGAYSDQNNRGAACN